MKAWNGSMIACILLAGLLPSAAQGQVEPKSPVHIGVNGVFFLCPSLVLEKVAPSSAELAKFGFETARDSAPTKLRFKSIDKRGVMFATYEAAEKRCIVDYGGPGYQAIAGMVRDTVTGNGLKRITGGDNGIAKSDVFQGPMPGAGKTARVIIIENYTNPSATISYSEPAGR